MYEIVGASDDQTGLHRETDARFWASTKYKPGQRLDPRDPQYAKMSKIWLQIFAGVLGHRDQATEHARKIYTETLVPYIFVSEQRGKLSHQAFNDRAAADQQYALAKRQPELHRYIALFDFTKNPRGPLHDQFPATAAAPSRSDARAEATLAILQEHARDLARRSDANIVGVVRGVDGQWYTPAFTTRDVAKSWINRVTGQPTTFLYAAVFDKTDRMWPYAVTEAIGHAAPANVAAWY